MSDLRLEPIAGDDAAPSGASLPMNDITDDGSAFFTLTHVQEREI